MNTALIDFANEHPFIFLGIGAVCSIILSFIMIWLIPYIEEGVK